jgi:hypothetical protein
VLEKTARCDEINTPLLNPHSASFLKGRAAAAASGEILGMLVVLVRKPGRC